MLRRVAHVRTDISEKFSASFIRVTRIGEPGTTLDVTKFTDSCHTEWGAQFIRNVDYYKSTRRNIPEDTILRSHRRENSKSYIRSLGFVRK
jgi:hypothetical protein